MKVRLFIVQDYPRFRRTFWQPTITIPSYCDNSKWGHTTDSKDFQEWWCLLGSCTRFLSTPDRTLASSFSCPLESGVYWATFIYLLLSSSYFPPLQSSTEPFLLLPEIVRSLCFSLVLSFIVLPSTPRQNKNVATSRMGFNRYPKIAMPPCFPFFHHQLFYFNPIWL